MKWLALLPTHLSLKHSFILLAIVTCPAYLLLQCYATLQADGVGPLVTWVVLSFAFVLAVFYSLLGWGVGQLCIFALWPFDLARHQSGRARAAIRHVVVTVSNALDELLRPFQVGQLTRRSSASPLAKSFSPAALPYQLYLLSCLLRN